MATNLSLYRRLDRLNPAAGACGRNNPSLGGGELVGRRLHGVDLVDRNHDGAVAIGVNQIAALYSHAGDLDVDAEVDDVHIGVRWHDHGGEHLEAFGDHRDVADRTVSDDAERTQGLVHVRLHLAPERAIAGMRAIEVVHDHDGGLRRARHVVEIVETFLHVPG